MTDYRVDRSAVLPLLTEGGRDAASPPHTLRVGAWHSPVTVSTPHPGRRHAAGRGQRPAAARVSGSAR